MKKIILVAIIFTSIFASAQRNRGEMREKIKAQKVAFITEKLDLSADEAAKFWPIYNTFEEATQQIKFKDLRAIKSEMRNNPDLSDEKAQKLLDKLIAAENDMHKAKVELVNDLREVISAKKIIRLKAAEDEFNRKLLERLKELRKKRGKP